ncbi:MAG TPA: kynureninase, partial [Actinomycetes bacterium]|nr:kynureninase [Actinomycetes bacterium]
MRDRAEAQALDRADPLRHLRERFELPDGLIYLDGNSLGPLPVRVRDRLARVVDGEWGRDLIASWNKHDWIGLPARVGARIAQLIGAPPDSVVVGDSTTVQLFKLLVAATRLRPDRRVLVTDPGNFPTDSYIVASVARLAGLELRWCDPEDVAASLDHSVAAVELSHVDYRTGRMYDAAEITAAVQEAGAVVLWDLCHSAGAVPVDLHGWDADLAVGCGYKYLNGGPGAPAFGYIHHRWHDILDQPITGWMGHAAPFALERAYRPAPGVARMLAGTPPILSMSALDAALDAFDGVSMTDVRAKSLALTDYFVALVEDRLFEHGVTVEVPRAHDRRGSQGCLRHPGAYGLVQALIARGVVGDFRDPDYARFGFTPLYLRFVDVWDAVEHMAQVLSAGEWEAPEYA